MSAGFGGTIDPEKSMAAGREGKDVFRKLVSRYPGGQWQGCVSHEEAPNAKIEPKPNGAAQFWR